ncbi:ankyrin repeat-containing protein [Reticulomyxa filosa]|uniref:Ankyrin repeat-containing protein n=1 Tax=Reticulomyxa filosa TaxID=46433 RepID=X6N5Z5_RETFI|nr:ankyrin repeat-containing protein [Reticulomyxa filosa]|eukprot:ETO21348.1 ankyrin repeat-containing protein [Reticulomyxa filosa]
MSTKSKLQTERNKQKESLKNEIQSANLNCADCGQKSPEWVSINLGVVVCLSCSGIHRSLGTHVSKIRSICLDDIPLTTLAVLQKLGNAKVNQLLEHTIPSSFIKCNPNSEGYVLCKLFFYSGLYFVREKFIKEKYMLKLFVNPNDQKSHEELNCQLYQSAKLEDLLSILEAICHGGNVNCVSSDLSQNGRTPLHAASLENKELSVELLLQNSASHSVKDADGKTPRELAVNSNFYKIVDILDSYDPFSSGRKKRSIEGDDKSLESED